MGACSSTIQKNSVLPSRHDQQSQEAVWKERVKESPTLGKTHHDTENENQDILGLKTAVEQIPYIKTIEVHHDDKQIYGYQMYYHFNNYTPKKRHYGWNAHPGVKCERVQLEPGEYICAAGGRFGKVCHRLWFQTDSGRVLSFGASDENGEGEERTFDTSQAEKPLIVALGVGMGGSVHNAKVYYLDLMDLPLQPTSGPLQKYSGSLQQNSSGAYTSVIQSRSIVAPPNGSMVLPPTGVVLPPTGVALPPGQAQYSIRNVSQDDGSASASTNRLQEQQEYDAFFAAHQQEQEHMNKILSEQRLKEDQDKQAEIAAQLSLPAQNSIQPQPVLNQINRADSLLQPQDH